MTEFYRHIALFFVPMILANIIHMIIVKRNYLSALAKPISVKLFGKNKTYRGFFVLILFSGLLALSASSLHEVSSSTALIIGSGLGFFYALFELPNSYIKRRLGISSGETNNKFRYIQLILDKCDSIIGICIFYYVSNQADIVDISIIFSISLFLHIAISFLLYKVKIKENV